LIDKKDRKGREKNGRKRRRPSKPVIRK